MSRMENDSSRCVKGRPDKPDSARAFIDGSIRSSVLLRSCAIGFGTYNPGWKWSNHAGPQTGRPSDTHVGYILSGAMMIRDSTGIETKVGPAEAFEVGPRHDAWVIGDEPCIALDFIPIQVE